MAAQRGETPRTKGQGQQTRQSQHAQSQATQGSTGAAASTGEPMGAGGAQGETRGTDQRSEQERQLGVSRERAASPAVGTQRGARQTGAGTAVAGRGQGQPLLLPAFMANPGLMASAFMADPFAFAEAMSDEMDRLFANLGRGETSPSYGQVATGGRGVPAAGGQRDVQRGMSQAGRGLTRWVPQIEVIQRGSELVVRADLPGLTPDDVQIEIEDGVLTISGERRQTAEEREEGFYRSERSYGAFSRSIALPEGLDEEQVKARFEHGVLEVTVPLPQQQRPRGRRVQIQGGAGQSAGQQVGQQSDRQPGDRTRTQGTTGAERQTST